MKKCIIFLIIQFVFVLPLISQVNLDSLLVAYYPFNGNANDESGNGNNGTVAGATLIEDRFGNPNSAYSFNGFTDYIDFGDVFNDVFLPFSISVWIYKEQIGPPNQNILKSDNYPGTGISYYYGFWLTTVDATEQPSVAISYGDGGVPDPDNRRTKNTAATIYLSQWVHIAVNVNEPTDMTVYFNTFDAGGTYSGAGGSMVHSDWTANMGKNTLPPNVYFNGVLDDVRIFDRLLTIDEINALYEEEVVTKVFENPKYSTSNIRLNQNFPNPFAGQTTISYSVVETCEVSMTILSSLGEVTRLIDNKIHYPGNYLIKWDARDKSGTMLPAGIYFYQIRSEKFCETKRMIILR
jgi:hypothetical protein